MHLTSALISATVLAFMDIKYAIILTLVYSISCFAYLICFQQQKSSSNKQEIKNIKDYKDQKFKSAKLSKPHVPNPRHVPQEKNQENSPNQPPPSQRKDEKETMKFPNLSELTPVRFRNIPQNNEEYDMYRRTVDDEVMKRGNEPNFKNYHTEGRRKLQKVLASELTTRDPNIRPLNGKFDCKPSLGSI